jgi:hypothetical protein
MATLQSGSLSGSVLTVTVQSILLIFVLWHLSYRDTGMNFKQDITTSQHHLHVIIYTLFCYLTLYTLCALSNPNINII